MMGHNICFYGETSLLILKLSLLTLLIGSTVLISSIIRICSFCLFSKSHYLRVMVSRENCDKTIKISLCFRIIILPYCAFNFFLLLLLRFRGQYHCVMVDYFHFRSDFFFFFFIFSLSVQNYRRAIEVTVMSNC